MANHCHITPGLPGETPSEIPDPLGELHGQSLMLRDLLEAVDDLAHLMGPKSGPVYAILTLALPIARTLARDLEGIQS